MDVDINILNVSFYNQTQAEWSLGLLLSCLRGFIPRITLIFNADGCWCRCTTSALSLSLFMQKRDFFQDYIIDHTQGHCVLLHLLTHELDLILNDGSTTSTQRNTTDICRLVLRKNDTSHVWIEKSGTSSYTRSCIQLCEEHGPYASGDLIPPQTLTPLSSDAEISSSGCYIAPKDLIRTIRNHKAQTLSLTHMMDGGISIHSEHNGNTKETELRGSGIENRFNPTDQPGIKSLFLSGVLLATLRCVQNTPASRFRIDRVTENETNGPQPLALMAALGHNSYIRFFLPDNRQAFSTKATQK